MHRYGRRAFVTLTSAAGAVALAAPGAAADGPGGGDRRREAANRAVVLAAFARQNSGGSFYDVLAEDVTWTIVNGRTYHSKAEFLAEGSAPVLDRLATGLRMTPRDVRTDRDTVIARFEGDGTARDGVPYHNEYCWILTLRRERVVRVHAFLDTVAVADLIDRVDLGRGAP